MTWARWFRLRERVLEGLWVIPLVGVEELLEPVRLEHRAAVEEELRRLDATVAEGWRDSVDLDRASEADGQGIGGPARGPRSV